MLPLDTANDLITSPRIWSAEDGAWDTEAFGSGPCVHGRAAWATALEDGLLGAEIRGVLAGRRITDAFPIRRGENPQAYATRATAEMLVAYLS